MLGEVVEHVLHAATATKILHRAEQAELAWSCTEQEHDEVTLDVGYPRP